MQLENIYNGKSMSEISIQDMFDISNTNPANKIYADDDAAEELFYVLMKLGRLGPNDYDISLDVDILLSGLISFPDCELNLYYEEDGKSAYDRYRIYIFPNYMNIIKKAQNSSAIVGFININNTIVPLAVTPDIKTIGYGDIFLEDGSYISFVDSHFNETDYSIRDMYVFISSVWYAVQIASIDPLTKNLFVADNSKFDNYSNNYILSAESIKARLEP